MFCTCWASNPVELVSVCPLYIACTLRLCEIASDQQEDNYGSGQLRFPTGPACLLYSAVHIVCGDLVIMIRLFLYVCYSFPSQLTRFKNNTLSCFKFVSCVTVLIAVALIIFRKIKKKKGRYDML